MHRNSHTIIITIIKKRVSAVVYLEGLWNLPAKRFSEEVGYGWMNPSIPSPHQLYMPSFISPSHPISALIYYFLKMKKTWTNILKISTKISINRYFISVCISNHSLPLFIYFLHSLVLMSNISKFRDLQKLMNTYVVIHALVQKAQVHSEM